MVGLALIVLTTRWPCVTLRVVDRGGVMRKHKHGFLSNWLHKHIPLNTQDRTLMVKEFLHKARDHSAQVKVVGVSGQVYKGKVEHVDDCGAKIKTDPELHHKATALVLDNIESVTRL